MHSRDGRRAPAPAASDGAVPRPPRPGRLAQL